jgi:hypothetical protein
VIPRLGLVLSLRLADRRIAGCHDENESHCLTNVKEASVVAAPRGATVGMSRATAETKAGGKAAALEALRSGRKREMDLADRNAA